MATQAKSQSQGFGIAGTENRTPLGDVERVLASLESFYTDEAQQSAEAALEALGRILSTGSFELEDVEVLADLEEQLADGLAGIESVREAVAELRARL